MISMPILGVIPEEVSHLRNYKVNSPFRELDDGE
jgi:hypothetical protein